MKAFLKSVPTLVWVALGLVGVAIAWYYVIPKIQGYFVNAGASADQYATGQTPTLTSQQAQGMADSIFNDGNVFWANNTTDLDSQFQLMNNDADFDLVKGKFGVRTWGGVVGLGGSSGDMIAFIHAFFSASDIAAANAILTAKSIKNQI